MATPRWNVETRVRYAILFPPRHILPTCLTTSERCEVSHLMQMNVFLSHLQSCHMLNTKKIVINMSSSYDTTLIRVGNIRDVPILIQYFGELSYKISSMK